MIAAGLVSRDRGEIARHAGLLCHQRRIAGHALDDVVISRLATIRAAGIKAMQSGVNQSGVSHKQLLRVQPNSGQLLRPHAVHEDIGATDQLLQRGLTIGLFEVDDDALLAAIDAEKNRRHAGFCAGAGLARRVTLGCFDLDHFGAEVGQPLTRVGAHHHRSSVDHPDARKR